MPVVAYLGVAESLHESRGEACGFDGGNPQPLKLGDPRQLRDKIGQRRPRLELAAPSAQVDSGQNDFMTSGATMVAHFVHDACGRPATTGPSRDTNDAVAAALIAPVLNLDKGPRSAQVIVDLCQSSGRWAPIGAPQSSYEACLVEVTDDPIDLLHP